MTTTSTILTLGDITVTPRITAGALSSLGDVRVQGVSLRNPATRFLPWFDTYQGDVFRTFAFRGIEQRGAETVLALTARSDQDYPFRERRDSSGDICLREANWDDPPLDVAFRIVLAPRQETIDGRDFTGMTYWFEVESDAVPIHRLIDRQTWEVGGTLDDVTLLCRNWLTPPRVRVARDTVYSTVGLDEWSNLLPGNLWGRWSLLPGFDLQYGAAGVLVGWFDEVSCIRTVIETKAGEDCLRCVDLHYFPQATTVRTNAKTILWSPDVLDDVDAMNLWTRLQDRDHAMSCAQFGIRDEAPPKLTFHCNHWVGMNFDTSYEPVVEDAAAFGADLVFIDPIWENEQSLQEWLRTRIPEEDWANSELAKFYFSNMCIHLDNAVAHIRGGEPGLKALCDRAAEKGVGIISWMSAHFSLRSMHTRNPDLGHGACGLFAARESGRHPEGGYPTECAPANLNAPIRDYLIETITGVCQRTGLQGFLWDSFSNLGWWHVDYSDGSMRPQFDKMAGLYAALANTGLYLMPEALCAFSNHSGLAMFSGEIYADDLLGYSYNTTIALHAGAHTNEPLDFAILRGDAPIDLLFRALAHKRAPNSEMWRVPQEQRDPQALAEIRRVYALYKHVRPLMQRRTVLKDGAGVLWEGPQGERLLFAFQEQTWPGEVHDAVTGDLITGPLQANHAFRVTEGSER